MQRRKLDLPNAEAVLAEVNRLREEGYQPLGKWNLGQICEHLTETIRFGLDPSNRRLPWIVRKLFTTRAFHRVLRTRKMATGIPIPRRIKPKSSAELDDPTKIDEYLALVTEIQEFQGPLPPFPLADDVRLEDWKQIQWIHAGHHLSFLVPKPEEATAQA